MAPLRPRRGANFLDGNASGALKRLVESRSAGKKGTQNLCELKVVFHSRNPNFGAANSGLEVRSVTELFPSSKKFFSGRLHSKTTSSIFLLLG
jgi:hypothetical protein